jgi:hypothetical protein
MTAHRNHYNLEDKRPAFGMSQARIVPWSGWLQRGNSRSLNLLLKTLKLNSNFEEIKMSKYFVYSVIFIVIVIVIGVLSYGSRLLNNKVTPIAVTEVEKGIKCASMVTQDGAAISCWKM